MKKTMKRCLTKLLAITLILTCLFSTTVFAATSTYTVVKGDSLWKIAVKNQVGVSEIINMNPQFKNPALIYPGDKVTIPLVDQGTKSLEEQVAALVNQERAKAGLKPLTFNWEVARIARTKSEDMRDKGYFSHTSPTYGTPFDMLSNFGIKYKTAGENIAKGQTTAAAVMNSWMNSPGHKANILNPNFTQIGVGYAKGAGSTFWTQMFIA